MLSIHLGGLNKSILLNAHIITNHKSQITNHKSQIMNYEL